MKQGDNVNDNVNLKGKDNVNDNVREETFERYKPNVSDYRLATIEDFLYKSYSYGSSRDLINPAIKQLERFLSVWLTDLDGRDRELISTGVKYKDYTESPLWKINSLIVMVERSFTCERCHQQYRPAGLVIHHKSYEHIGSELLYKDDVELLCNHCHMEEHNIKKA